MVNVFEGGLIIAMATVCGVATLEDMDRFNKSRIEPANIAQTVPVMSLAVLRTHTDTINFDNKTSGQVSEAAYPVRPVATRGHQMAHGL